MSIGNPQAPRQPRRRVLKSGLVCFNGRHSTLACTVRDFSESGARLTVASTISIPDAFELFIELDGIWVDCTAVWRRSDQIGVRFTSPVRHTDPARRQVIIATPPEPKKPTLRRVPKS